MHIAGQELNAVPQTSIVHDAIQPALVSRRGVVLHEVYLLQCELDHGEAALDCDVHEGKAAAQKAEDARQLVVVFALFHLPAHVLPVARLLLHLGSGLVVPIRVFRREQRTSMVS